MSNIKTFDDTLSDTIAQESVVFVDFYAEWCMPCRTLLPTIEEIATEFQDSVVVGKLNIDEYHTLATDYKVTALPTLVLFKDGTEVKRFVGLRGANEIKAAINELV